MLQDFIRIAPNLGGDFLALTSMLHPGAVAGRQQRLPVGARVLLDGLGGRRCSYLAALPITWG
jgi:hypothetical protein